MLRREFLELDSAAAVASIPAVSSALVVPASAHVSIEMIEIMRRKICRLRKLDDYLGGADTYHLYSNEADRTLWLLKSTSTLSSLRQQLIAVYAEQLQQAGWAAFDAGWTDLSEDLFQRSYAAATDCNDAGLSGNSLALLSYQHLETRGPSDEATRKSLRMADGCEVNAHVRALLYMRGAWTFSRAGDADATAEALERAEESLSRSTDESVPDYASWVDETELLIMKGRCWAELRRPLRSVPLLEMALNAYSDVRTRDKALYSSWLADSYIDAGEVEKATEVVSVNMALARDVASVRPQRRLCEVAERLTNFRALPVVADFLSSDAFHPRDIGR